MAAILHIQCHWGRSPSADVKLTVPICSFQPLPVSYQWIHLAGCLLAQPSSAIDICTKAVWCCGWLFRVVAMGYISLKALLKRHVLREREWEHWSQAVERGDGSLDWWVATHFRGVVFYTASHLFQSEWCCTRWWYLGLIPISHSGCECFCLSYRGTLHLVPIFLCTSMHTQTHTPLMIDIVLQSYSTLGANWSWWLNSGAQLWF